MFGLRALGMAYFFVLKTRHPSTCWCRGNVGEKIFAPWVEQMAERGVTFVPRLAQPAVPRLA